MTSRLMRSTTAPVGARSSPLCIGVVCGILCATVLSVPRPAAAQEARVIGGTVLDASGAAIDGIPTAGKSGTAELGGSGEPHSWFIGFAPADDPQIAIAVLVEQGGRGGERAAPLAGSLMRAYLVDGVGR